ncbi:hypothetical protein WA026_020460 [Henosepilachna vigintioctopunctata]|uniref:Uncharacterized protein n=1 Tax=Henosepilachna vigintioctopunctata TaxID=420089 RepID=A0AAW1VJ07_9CUCU
MIDYFKKKMLLNKKITVKEEVQLPNIETNSDEEISSVGFGFNRGIENKVKSTFLSYIKENNHNQNGIEAGEPKDLKTIELPAKNNLKRKPESELSLAFTPLKKKFKNFESLNSLQDDEKIETTPKNKCKKKKVKSEYLDKNGTEITLDKSEKYGMANPGFDPVSNAIAIKKHFLDAIKEENENLQNESPKKKPLNDEEIEEIPLKRKKKSLEHKDNMEKNKEFHLEKNKSEKKKKSKAKKGIDNSCFEDLPEDSSFLNSGDHCQSVESVKTFNIKSSKKSKKVKKEIMQSYIENSAFHENIKTSADEVEYPNSEKKNNKKKNKMETEEYECSSSTFNEDKKKIKKKKLDNCYENYKENIQTIQDNDECLQNFQQKASKTKKKKEKYGANENPCFNPNDSIEGTEQYTSLYEVKRKKKTVNLGIDNAGLNISSSTPEKCEAKQVKLPLQLEMPIMDEIILNVVDAPILKKTEECTPVQKRKSVRFSEVNQSIFMNKADSPADLLRNGSGFHNEAYDELGNRMEENIDSLSKQLDDFQAEVENDINQAKFEVMVGEMGDPHGENEILPDGDVKLKFKYANFGKIPPWLKKNGNVNARTSYRHLIKGDIILGFKNTNLHEIEGYDHIKKLDRK